MHRSLGQQGVARTGLQCGGWGGQPPQPHSGLVGVHHLCSHRTNWLHEQFVQKWDRLGRVDGDDTIEHAKLDVAFTNCHGQRTYLDVVVPTAGSTNVETVRARAVKDGAAAARAEDGKRVRYPGPDLVPFAVEALGRPGKDAVAFLRSLAPADPELRSAALGAAWQSLSVLLQMENADLVLSAAGACGTVRSRGGR